MEWLNLDNNEELGGNLGDTPTPFDNCVVYWCLRRNGGDDGGCFSRICWIGKGCFSDY